MDNISKKEEFETLCLHLINKYDNNVSLLKKETTSEIFKLTKDTNNKVIMPITLKQINEGKFYLIQYNYNGNKIWCPIFTLEYKVIKNKNILYTINLDYLPYLFKAKFFGQLFYLFRDEIEKSQKVSENARQELPFKGVTFEGIYKKLKNNGGYDFSVTAFDMEKIKKIFVISYDMVHRFIFLNTKLVNTEKMKMQKLEIEDIEIQKKLEQIIQLLESLDKQYNDDVKEYYKILKSIEQKYKLVENI